MRSIESPKWLLTTEVVWQADPNGDSMRVDSFQTNFVDNKPFTVFMVSLADNSTYGITPTNIGGSTNRFYPNRGGLRYQTNSSDVTVPISSVDNQLEIDHRLSTHGYTIRGLA